MKKTASFTVAALVIIALSSSSTKEAANYQACGSITNLRLRDAITGSVVFSVKRSREYIVDVLPGSNNVSGCILLEADYSITTSGCSDITLGSYSPIGRIFINA